MTLRVQLADDPHISLVQLRAAVLLPSAIRRPAACPHVVHIVPWRAEQDVARSATGRIVAGVSHEHAIGDGAVEHLPDDTVNACVHAVHLNLAVAVPVAESLPLPTPTAPVVHVGPKARPQREFQSLRAPSVVTVDEAVAGLRYAPAITRAEASRIGLQSTPPKCDATPGRLMNVPGTQIIPAPQAA